PIFSSRSRIIKPPMAGVVLPLWISAARSLTIPVGACPYMRDRIMMPSSYHDSFRRTRRTFLIGAAAGLAAGGPLGWLGLRAYQDLRRRAELGSRFTGRTVEDRHAAYAMPGPFRGKGVEVHHPGSVRPDNTICGDAVKAMMDRGMCGLTGADHAVEAWRRFFEPGDVVGVKVNPVGRKPLPGERGRRKSAVGSISSPEVLLEI